MWCTISYSDEGLKNIYYFDLVVEKVKDNKCGVTNENIEREALLEKILSIAKKCKVDNEVFSEVISKGSQFKDFNNTLEDFKSSLSSTSLYIFDGDKINYGEDGNIKFSINTQCINRFGTLVKGEEPGLRADISLIDHRTLYQTVKDNEDFEKEQLDKSGLQ